MYAPVESNHASSQRPRWQISLGDLSLLVVAAGVAAGVARRARDPWRVPLGGPVLLPRLAGVVLEVAAIFLILTIVRTLIGLVRSVRGLKVNGKGRLVASITWRVAAVVILAAFVADESDVLRIDHVRQAELMATQAGSERIYVARQNLLPIFGTLTVVGLGLGMGARAIFDDPRPASRRPYWLFVLLGALVAILLAGTTIYSLIVYLVLQSLEAVSNARNFAPREGPGLARRLLDTGGDASLALVACVALAVMVAHDFDQAGRRLPWATTLWSRLLRLVLLLVAVGAGIHVAAVCIPHIHTCFAEGIEAILTPELLLLTVGGFGLLALGMAARAVAPSLSPAKSTWLRWLSAILRYGLLLVVWLAAMKNLPSSTQMNEALPVGAGAVIDAIGRGQAWVWGLLPYPVLIAMQYCLEYETLQWIASSIFVGLVVVELLFRKPSARDAPFDAILNSGRAALEVGWLATAFTIVCVVALPILVVMSQWVLHVQLNLADWRTFGWPR